jgi:MscS family membrane protein
MKNLLLTLLPERYETINLLGLFLWQWLGLMLILILSLIASTLASFFLQALLVKTFKKITSFDSSQPFLEPRFLGKPLNIMLQGWFVLIGLSFLSLSPKMLNILVVGVKVLTYYGVTFFLWRLTDIFNYYLLEITKETDSKFDDLLAPLVNRSLKLLFFILGAFSIAEILKLPLSSLLAGLGIGGIAIAMAAKDTISNIFGSITIVLDRPFKIGDWIVVDNVEGSVEKLGFRSTRLRTFYNSLVTVPNSTVSTAVVDNMGERKYRRIKTMLGVTYNTSPEKIDLFCDGIKQLIETTEFMRKDYYHVYFNKFGDFSLQILLYCFIEADDWSQELKTKHIFFNSILKLAKTLEIEFAYPTQTLHIEKENQ